MFRWCFVLNDQYIRCAPTFINPRNMMVWVLNNHQAKPGISTTAARPTIPEFHHERRPLPPPNNHPYAKVTKERLAGLAKRMNRAAPMTCPLVPGLFLPLHNLGTRYTFLTGETSCYDTCASFTRHQPYSLATGQQQPAAQIQVTNQDLNPPR